MDSDGWQTVRRGRTRAAPSSAAPHRLLETSELSAYGGRATYAQILSTGKPTDGAPVKKPPPPRNNLPPPHRARPQQPTLITSPDSPTTLAFPPTPEDPDWFNRYFRCFRKGHTSKKCLNRRRCATCWGLDHDFRDCTNPHRQAIYHQANGHRRRHQALNHRQGERTLKHQPTRPPPPPPPPVHRHKPRHQQQPDMVNEEPDFLDLLTDPNASSVLPPDADRPTSVTCFLTRDEKYFSEIASLSKSLVITQPADTMVELSLDNIAKMVESTGLVKAN